MFIIRITEGKKRVNGAENTFLEEVITKDFKFQNFPNFVKNVLRHIFIQEA